MRHSRDLLTCNDKSLYGDGLDDCRYHVGVPGKRLCGECGGRVCDGCAVAEVHREAETNRRHTTCLCKSCETDREIAKLKAPRLATIVLLIAAVPLAALLAAGMVDLVFVELAYDPSDPGASGFLVAASIYLVAIGLPLIALRHEIRRIRSKPGRIAELEERRRSLGG